MINKKRVAGLLVLFAGLVMILSSCGGTSHVTGVAKPVSSSSTSPAPVSTPVQNGPAQLKVGEHADIGDNQNNQEGTVSVDKVIVTQRPADSEFGEPPANGWYVIVHVTAAADSAYMDGFNVNTFDFSDVMNGGRVFSTDTGNSFEALNSAQENEDITATLGAGQSSSGWLAFDVPRPHGQIVYAPNFDGQPIAAWSY
jgi:hypothetical protein